MKIKDNLDKKYHFKTLPFPQKITADEADNRGKIMNNLLSNFRRELYDFDEKRGYLLLGYKNMPAFVASRIQEISPRYANTLLEATKIEKGMGLGAPIGTVPYMALVLLKPFTVILMKKLWEKSLSEALTGESIVSALKRIIRFRKEVDY